MIYPMGIITGICDMFIVFGICCNGIMGAVALLDVLPGFITIGDAVEEIEETFEVYVTPCKGFPRSPAEETLATAAAGIKA